MYLDLKPAAYVVAVSGGVDSMSLLHILHELQVHEDGIRLIVAHYDHGIRSDSELDRKLVERVARRYGLPFVYEAAHLGKVSEAAAREKRYAFLRAVRKQADADFIITAHHEDDVLETAILNIIRGTNRKGLTSLRSRADIVRPLLHISKRELRQYAQTHELDWREDETNADLTLLRNYIRHAMLPRFDAASRIKLRQLIDNLQVTNDELDNLLANQLNIQSVNGMIDRQWFVQLPDEVAREVLATWLRAHGERKFNRKKLKLLVVAAQTGRPGNRYSLSKQYSLGVGRKYLALT
jgi:tRNA(Ile)-lysidine synthase